MLSFFYSFEIKLHITYAFCYSEWGSVVNSVHLTLTNPDLITENLVTFDLMNEYGINAEYLFYWYDSTQV